MISLDPPMYIYIHLHNIIISTQVHKVANTINVIFEVGMQTHDFQPLHYINITIKEVTHV